MTRAETGVQGDDQFEFELAVDVLLDGIERLHERGWTSHTDG